VRGLENTLIKLLLSLEFFDEPARRKISMGEQGAHVLCMQDVWNMQTAVCSVCVQRRWCI
jgi:hypothetical protein